MAWFLGLSLCRADLDETLDQMIARYGQPAVKKEKYDGKFELTHYRFLQGPYVIYITIGGDTGREVSTEQIYKWDHSAFSDAEIEMFVNRSSSAEHPWVKDGPYKWSRVDAWAFYLTDPTPHMRLFTAE